MNVRLAGALSAAALLFGAEPALPQISNDRLCQAIGETPNIAVPPRDRAFFQDKCECLNGECAYIGSAQHRRLKAAVTCEVGARELIAKQLGREVADDESFGSDSTWGEVIEVFCMKHRSASRVAKELKPGILVAKQKDRDERCATNAYVYAHEKSEIDLKARCEIANDAREAQLVADVKAEHEKITAAEEVERQRLAKQRELEEDARVRLHREMSWNARQWFNYERQAYLQGCQQLYKDQQQERVAIYCECMLQRTQERGNARVVEAAVKTDPKQFRAQTAPARAECGDFAGVKPRD